MSSNPHYEGDPKAITVDGKESFVFKPRALNIVWGNDGRYWDVPKPQETEKAAELLQVCWLEVTGSVEVDPKKSYEVEFKVSLTPDAFGWGGSPIYIMVKRGKFGNFVGTKHPLSNSNGTITCRATSPGIKENQEEEDGKKLFFGLYEVWSGKWKGGLKIHQVKIRQLS